MSESSIHLYSFLLLPEAKAFVRLVLLTSFWSFWMDDPEYEIMELYAGAARITKLAKAIGISACAHDVTYDTNERSCFDLLGNAGFVLL